MTEMTDHKVAFLQFSKPGTQLCWFLSLSPMVHSFKNFTHLNRSPAQVGCMRQVLGVGALERPRGMGCRGRRDGGLEWGTHINP